MPYVIRTTNIFLPTGSPPSPDQTNYSVSGLNAGQQVIGEKGQAFDYNTRVYQRVQLDSGATSATPTGAPAVGQVLMWKDKANYIVTNDSRFAYNSSGVANAFRDQAAGILMNAATPGNIIDMLIKGTVPVASDGNGTKGEQAFMVATTTTPVVGNIAVGTASGYLRIGFMNAAPSGGFVSVDVDLTYQP